MPEDLGLAPLLPKIVIVRDQLYSSLEAFVDHEFVLQYCVEGDVDFWVERNLYQLTPGTALLMAPNSPHGFRAARTAQQRYIVVHFMLVPNSKLHALCPLYARLGDDAVDRVAASLGSLVEEWRNPREWQEIVAPGLLMEVLGLCARHAEGPLAPRLPNSPSWRYVEAALVWLNRNYRRNITLTEMASHSGLSEAHFSKAFKAHTGTTPHKYLSRLKIERAREMLCDANKNCSTIADELGYPNVASFSRSFRDITGLSPMNWIKQYPAPIARSRK